MSKLNTMKEMVRHQLEIYPATRSSDALLYYRICEQIDSNAMHEPFGFVLLNLKDFNLPTIESVGRCRRKLQEEHPEFAATEKVENFRAMEEQEYIDFARGL